MHPQKSDTFGGAFFMSKRGKNYFHNFSGYRPISCRCLREFGNHGLVLFISNAVPFVGTVQNLYSRFAPLMSFVTTLGK